MKEKEAINITNSYNDYLVIIHGNKGYGSYGIDGKIINKLKTNTKYFAKPGKEPYAYVKDVETWEKVLSANGLNYIIINENRIEKMMDFNNGYCQELKHFMREKMLDSKIVKPVHTSRDPHAADIKPEEHTCLRCKLYKNDMCGGGTICEDYDELPVTMI